MRVRDQRLRARVRYRPDRGHRLRHRDREVTTSRGAAGAALGFLGLDRDDLLRRAAGPSSQSRAFTHALLDPFRNRGELLVGTAQTGRW